MASVYLGVLDVKIFTCGYNMMLGKVFIVLWQSGGHSTNSMTKQTDIA